MVEKQPTAWIPGPPVYLSDPAPCGCEIDKLNEPHDLIDYGSCLLRGTTLISAWKRTEEVEDRYWPGNRTRSFEGLVVALTSEVGEVADQVKRLGGYGSSERSFSQEELLTELTDVQSYLICFCMRLGISQNEFAAAMTAKMLVVEERMRVRRT